MSFGNSQQPFTIIFSLVGVSSLFIIQKIWLGNNVTGFRMCHMNCPSRQFQKGNSNRVLSNCRITGLREEALKMTVLKLTTFSCLFSSFVICKKHSLLIVTFWFCEETKAFQWNQSKMVWLGCDYHLLIKCICKWAEISWKWSLDLQAG